MARSKRERIGAGDGVFASLKQRITESARLGRWRIDKVSAVRFTVDMKNITVSVDDETYHRARVRAAERRTSLSAVVRRHLIELAGEETETERLKRQEAEIIAGLRKRHSDFSAGNRLTRDEIHDRHALH